MKTKKTIHNLHERVAADAARGFLPGGKRRKKEKRRVTPKQGESPEQQFCGK
jgi:hypothetical protein